MKAYGKKVWIVAEGYIPPESTGPAPEMTSHESISIINTSANEARLRITVFYADKEPVGPYEVTVPGRRSTHVRFNDLSDPAPIPKATEYSSVIESDVPIVVQHTRLDSRQPENALISTIAYGED